MTGKLPIVVLISGNGSNLQAIVDAKLNIDIRAVISNCANAYGLERAKQAGIATHVIAHQDFSSRQAFDQALAAAIDQHQPQLVVLAGFMRKLGALFVKHYHGQMINIHPSLLPKYPGLHTHQRVLEAGDSEHGASIHYVTEEVDGGPIICQAKLAIQPNDTPDSLKQRVQQLEHQLYPQVLAWITEGRLHLENDQIMFDNGPVSQQGVDDTRSSR